MATTLPLYRGFSSASYLTNRAAGFMVTNQECVKQDLLNHLYTIPGERVHQPDFGTRIPLLAFEPLDQTTLEIVRTDLRKVIDYDPRVRLIDMTVQAAPDNNMIIAFVDLLYVELNVTETLKLDFSVGG
jgi:phage baseplate assembly protein W